MNELEHLLPVVAVPAAGCRVELAASPAQCAAIADRLGIPAMHSLKARFDLLPTADGAIAATLRLKTRLRRVCVVSLEEFDTSQSIEARLRFVPEGRESPDDDPEADDELPFVHDQLDLGEAAVEQLALDLDPYPRRADAALPSVNEDATVSPFAALAALRRPS